MTKVLIFGAAEQAQLAYYYFRREGLLEVVGFIVDDEFKNDELFESLPLFSTTDFLKNFNSQDVKIFIALGYSKVNQVRREKYTFFKNLGFRFASFISSRATILSDFPIGENAFILENNTIQPFVTIGDNVTLWSGNHIGHHSTIGDHSFVTSHVVISGGVSIGSSTFLGVNSTIRDHISIGDNCVIGAGSIIMKPVPDFGVTIPLRTELSPFDSNRLRRI
jgi:sugar O-acyltransferase (sialic acid O-acetyltransferase NeuD family)